MSSFRFQNVINWLHDYATSMVPPESSSTFCNQSLAKCHSVNIAKLIFQIDTCSTSELQSENQSWILAIANICQIQETIRAFCQSFSTFGWYQCSKKATIKYSNWAMCSNRDVLTDPHRWANDLKSKSVKTKWILSNTKSRFRTAISPIVSTDSVRKLIWIFGTNFTYSRRLRIFI